MSYWRVAVFEAGVNFFQMGGYAFYVWPAYVITFLVIAANIVGARVFHNKLVNRLKRERMLNNSELRVDVEPPQGDRP